ncbi:phosphoribosylpyrophosphate synthetase, partial [Pseudomonas aeruginosa]
PDTAALADRQPVLIDDIVSSARTMIQAIASVRSVGLPPPVCIGVHALFAADAYHALLAAGPQRVVTCDTVPHVSNGISVVAPLATAVQELMEAGAP